MAVWQLSGRLLLLWAVFKDYHCALFVVSPSWEKRDHNRRKPVGVGGGFREDQNLFCFLIFKARFGFVLICQTKALKLFVTWRLFSLRLCHQVTMTDRGAAERACKDPNPIIDGRKANVNLAYLGAKPRSLQTGKMRFISRLVARKQKLSVSIKLKAGVRFKLSSELQIAWQNEVTIIKRLFNTCLSSWEGLDVIFTNWLAKIHPTPMRAKNYN